MPKKIIASIFLTILLAACGEKSEHAPKPTKKQPTGRPNDGLNNPVKTPHLESVLENEIVRERIFLADLKEGDVLNFIVSGKIFSPQFGPTYVKSYPSSWKEKVCIDLTQSNVQCMEVKKTGSCLLRYKEYNGIKESDIIFGRNSKKFKIRLIIGENSYPLGKIVQHSRKVFISEFKVSHEMLSISDEAYLDVKQEESREPVKTGFLGFQSCDGVYKNGFTHEGSTETQKYSSLSYREYSVSVNLRRYIQK